MPDTWTLIGFALAGIGVLMLLSPAVITYSKPGQQWTVMILGIALLAVGEVLMAITRVIP